MKDFVGIAAVILSIEVIDHVFGKAVGTAVAITALVGCIVFLWHAGATAQAIEAQRAETVKQGSVADESAVRDGECAQTISPKQDRDYHDKSK